MRKFVRLLETAVMFGLTAVGVLFALLFFWDMSTPTLSHTEENERGMNAH